MIKIGRKNKFDEPSKILTIRVPESKYNYIKNLIVNLLEEYQSHENIQITTIPINKETTIGDLKAINIYKDLSQKIVKLMRKNRISKYSIDTQNIILDLMDACSKHLLKELGVEKTIIDITLDD